MKGLVIALAVIGVLSAFVVGIAVGFKTGFNPVGILSGGQGGSYQDGFNHARELLAKSGMFPAVSGKITSLSGTVKSVDDKGLIITVNSRVVMNPLDPQGPAERRIEVSGDTAIVAMIPIAKEDFEAAQKKFAEDMKAGNKATPPSMSTEEARKLSDINAGMMVTVTSNDDISVAPAIKAAKIVLSGSGTPNPILPGAPPPGNPIDSSLVIPPPPANPGDIKPNLTPPPPVTR
jgi:hypothetical protein